jgi:hypothetical protein
MLISPAEIVISAFGGVRATARAIGRSPGAVCKWKHRRENKGCDGFIPSAAQREILRVASKKKINITLDDLAFGREIKERRKNGKK